MVIFIRGKLRPESANPISRLTQAVYLPVLRLCLKLKTPLRARERRSLAERLGHLENEILELRKDISAQERI